MTSLMKGNQITSLSIIILIGSLFVMMLYPLTHIFSNQAENETHEHSQIPSPNNNHDDCIECLLASASALEKPASEPVIFLTDSSFKLYSDSSPEANRLIIGFTLRGPPFGLYMS